MGQKKKRSKRVQKTLQKETVTQRLAQRLRPQHEDLLDLDLDVKADTEGPPAAAGQPANADVEPRLQSDAPEQHAQELLSEELTASLGVQSGEDGANALILTADNKKKNRKGQQRIQLAPKLSKSQQRKLRKLEEIKELRKQRAGVSLAQSRYEIGLFNGNSFLCLIPCRICRCCKSINSQRIICNSFFPPAPLAR